MKDKNQELCSCGGKCEGICRETHRVKLVHEIDAKGKNTGKLIPKTCIALYKKEKKREKKRDDRHDHKREESHDMDYFDLIG